MNDKIDMHLHTDYSDGLLSPKQMVEYCFAKGIDEMAITDHDTVEGIFEAKREAERLGIKFHTGVEISIPVLIRLLWIIFALVVGSGIIAYIIAAIIMPYDTEVKDDDESYEYAPRD